MKNTPDEPKTAPEFSLIVAVKLKEEFENKGLTTLLELIVVAEEPSTGLIHFNAVPVGIIVPTVAAAPEPPVPPSTKSTLSPTK